MGKRVHFEEGSGKPQKKTRYEDDPPDEEPPSASSAASQQAARSGTGLDGKDSDEEEEDDGEGGNGEGKKNMDEVKGEWIPRFQTFFVGFRLRRETAMGCFSKSAPPFSVIVCLLPFHAGRPFEQVHFGTGVGCRLSPSPPSVLPTFYSRCLSQLSPFSYLLVLLAVLCSLLQLALCASLAVNLTLHSLPLSSSSLVLHLLPLLSLDPSLFSLTPYFPPFLSFLPFLAFLPSLISFDFPLHSSFPSFPSFPSFAGEERYDADYSLAADGIEIEPFNLKEEREGGGGYFDAAGNYVFRHGAGQGEEQDAWLDGLEQEKRTGASKYGDDDGSDDGNQNVSGNDDGPREMSDAAKAAMYMAIANLLAPKETVTRGLRRLGALTKKQKSQQKKQQPPQGRKELAAAAAALAATPEETAAAVAAFNQLTEAADALLLGNEPDVYGLTKETAQEKSKDCTIASQASNVFSVSAASPTANQQMWEYRDPQGVVQGPFSSVQMFQWRSQGFFAGEQAVDVRKHDKEKAAAIQKEKEKEKKEEGEKNDAVMGGTDDLMNDLDDSDDEAEAETETEGKEDGKEAATARGSDGGGVDEGNQWKKSDAINFAMYC